MTSVKGFVETSILLRKACATAPEVSPAVRTALEPLPGRSDGREAVKVMVIGSRRGVDNTIRVLYLLGFAELYEWSPIQPTQTPGEVMSLLRRWVALP